MPDPAVESRPGSGSSRSTTLSHRSRRFLFERWASIARSCSRAGLGTPWGPAARHRRAALTEKASSATAPGQSGSGRLAAPMRSCALLTSGTTGTPSWHPPIVRATRESVASGRSTPLRRRPRRALSRRTPRVRSRARCSPVRAQVCHIPVGVEYRSVDACDRCPGCRRRLHAVPCGLPIEWAEVRGLDLRLERQALVAGAGGGEPASGHGSRRAGARRSRRLRASVTRHPLCGERE
jgi:hypothetical protein